MKTIYIAAPLLLAALLLSSCKPSSNSSGTEAGFPVEAATLERQSGPGCKTEDGKCARIEMVYPMLSGGETLTQSINDSVRLTLSRILFMLNPEEDSAKTIDELADLFISSYASFLAEVPDYDMGWWIETSYEIHQNTSKLLSFELMVSSFTGGAHPIGFSETFNYAMPEGRPLSLEELIIDRTGFLQLVEKEFKLSRELPETANLADEGFFYGEPFALPANYVFTEEGLYLIYNVYEAAPYALGPTEFLLPYDKLDNLIQTERIKL
ncbi:MAG: DUF3298 domain-containing protein [Saprospiraceae bacterium]